jgi:hypothetical protein
MHVTAIGRLALARIGDFPGAVLFMGDSVVYQYGPRVQRLLDEGRLRKTVYFLVGPSCAPFPGITRRGPIGQCGAMLPAARDLLAKEPVDTVILGEFWAGNAGPDTFVDRAGQRMALVTDQAKDAVYANLRDFVRSLSSPTRRVYLILAAPSDPRFDPRRMIARSITGYRIDPAARTGVPTAELARAAAEIDARLSQIAGLTGAATIDPFPDVCGEMPRCAPFFGPGEPKFADDKHLRPVFVRDAITTFDAILTGDEPPPATGPAVTGVGGPPSGH